MEANVPEHVEFDRQVVAKTVILQAVVAEPVVVQQECVAVPQQLVRLVLWDVVPMSEAAVIDIAQAVQ